jgi:hypothetical protein
VYVVPGSPLRLPAEPDLSNLPTIQGAEAGDSLCAGQCLAAEDFDGDGEVDLAIASDRNDITGRVYFRYGDGVLPPAESVADYPALEQSPVTSNFGTEMTAPGDLDGDGIADLVVSDHGNGQASVDGGRVWVVRGSTARWVGFSQLSTAAWLTIEGVEESGEVGSALTGLGDVDCDGSDDLAVSGVFLDGSLDAAGVVGIWLGLGGGIDRVSDATTRILGGVGQQQFGSSLAHGDLDGDGEGDLIVGAEGYGTYSGRVYVFSDAF